MSSMGKSVSPNLWSTEYIRAIPDKLKIPFSTENSYLEDPSNILVGSLESSKTPGILVHKYTSTEKHTGHIPTE